MDIAEFVLKARPARLGGGLRSSIYASFNNTEYNSVYLSELQRMSTECPTSNVYSRTVDCHSQLVISDARSLCATRCRRSCCCCREREREREQ